MPISIKEIVYFAHVEECESALFKTVTLIIFQHSAKFHAEK